MNVEADRDKMRSPPAVLVLVDVVPQPIPFLTPKVATGTRQEHASP
jgi:hypothetical protein